MTSKTPNTWSNKTLTRKKISMITKYCELQVPDPNYNDDSEKKD